MRMDIKQVVTFCAVAAVVAAHGATQGGEKVYVGRRVPAAQQIPLHQVDHTPWDQLLHRYVDLQGNVNYRAWKASSSDQQRLDAYLNELSRGQPKARTTKEAKLAFWMNAYNAVTIKGILREYPTTSIRNHTARLFGYNIWKDLLLYVGGQPYGLEQIEHEVLRPMGDPRIHFGIVCASRSCPPIRNEAYLPDRVAAQLDDNAKRFFSRRENFRYVNGKFYVSSILKWFGEDFGDSQAAVLRRIAPYLPTEEARVAARAGRGTVEYLPYDWSLNEPPR